MLRFLNAVKMRNLDEKIDIFSYFAQNIDYGYTLEPPTNNLCFSTKIRKECTPGTPVNTIFYIKMGYKGVCINCTDMLSGWVASLPANKGVAGSIPGPAIFGR